MIPRIVSTGVTVALLATGMTLASSTTSTAADAAAATTTPTRFALSSSGYGTRVVGGDIPAGSDRSAFQVISCTNRAGLHRSNFEAFVNLLPLGTASGVRTDVYTSKRGSTVATSATNKLATVRLGSGLNPTLVIKGVESTSRVFHNDTGFHANTRTSVGSIAVDPDGTGQLPASISVDIPTDGETVTVAGLAEITLGPRTERANASGAVAQADALRVKLLLTDTVVFIAHSRAKMNPGIISGLFRGASYGSLARAVDGRVVSKMTPYLVMPCQGTNGRVVTADIARVDPSGLVVKGLSAAQSADQSADRAYGWERGRVARANIGNGDIVVTGVVGRANVHFVRGKGITKDIKGSTLGSLTINGERRSFPKSDTIRVPGVALLERNVVVRKPLTISVIALRVTLLDGSLAVVNLGYGKVGFTKSGL